MALPLLGLAVPLSQTLHHAQPDIDRQPQAKLIGLALNLQLLGWRGPKVNHLLSDWYPHATKVKQSSHTCQALKSTRTVIRRIRQGPALSLVGTWERARQGSGSNNVEAEHSTASP